MKKMASILALIFLISLSTACGAERAKVDISDGGDLTSAETPGKEAETTPESEAEPTTEEDASESESKFSICGASAPFLITIIICSPLRV